MSKFGFNNTADIFGIYIEPIKEEEMKKVLKTPVEHYMKIISYVEGFSIVEGQEKPDYTKMRKAINEAWGEEYCQLCDKHSSGSVACHNVCPLALKGQNCHDEGSHYHYMANAPTWSDWLIHARKLLEVLREIEKESKEVTYKEGDRFRYRGEIHMLCQVGYTVYCLIGITGDGCGNRLEDPIKTKSHEITQEELNKMHSASKDITLIEDK